MEVVADSATFTDTPVEVLAGTFPLVDARSYWVHVWFRSAGTAGGSVLWTLHDTTIGGTQLQQQLTSIETSGFGWPCIMTRLFVADATGDHTFAVAGDVVSGGGSARRESSSERPGYVWGHSPAKREAGAMALVIVSHSTARLPPAPAPRRSWRPWCASGSGNITLNAAAGRPGLLYVDYVEVS